MVTSIKWSISDYHRMIESNILTDKRCELIAGEILSMTPELPQHYNTAKRGAAYLTQLLQGHGEVRFNGPITLADSEPEPDIAIVKLPNSEYDHRHPNAKDIFWLIEVANSSLSKDLSLKKAVYAQAQIPEYWVINLQTKTLLVFRAPVGDDYSQEIVWTESVIFPLAFPQIEIEISRFFSDLIQS
ncbi:MAG: hypothetical protein RLZZ568_1798 [Cyanobacteriota bacterium]